MRSTIAQELAWAVVLLGDHDLARLEAQVLLASILECDRVKCIAWPEERVAADQVLHFRRLVERRAAGEPMAYLLKQQEWWSQMFEVTPDTLIPRPDTEKLIDVVIERVPEGVLTVVDVGTGSGIIACVLAQLRPAWRVIGVDKSEAALEMARWNATRLGLLNITWLYSDWLSAVQNEAIDIIVSNPPYLSETDPHLAALSFEPRMALVSGETGLEAFEAIIPQAMALLKPQGLLALEHGCEQAPAVQALLRGSGFTDIQTYHDLSDLPRVSVGVKP